MKCYLTIVGKDAQVKTIPIELDNEIITLNELIKAINALEGSDADALVELNDFLKINKVSTSDLIQCITVGSEKGRSLWTPFLDGVQVFRDFCKSLNIIIDLHTNDIINEIEKRPDLMNRIGLQFVNAETLQTKHKIHGVAERYGENIRLATVNLKNPNSFLSTLRHELIHAMTADFLFYSGNSKAATLTFDFCTNWLEKLFEKFYNIPLDKPSVRKIVSDIKDAGGQEIYARQLANSKGITDYSYVVGFVKTLKYYQEYLDKGGSAQTTYAVEAIAYMMQSPEFYKTVKSDKSLDEQWNKINNTLEAEYKKLSGKELIFSGFNLKNNDTETLSNFYDLAEDILKASQEASKVEAKLLGAVNTNINASETSIESNALQNALTMQLKMARIEFQDKGQGHGVKNIAAAYDFLEKVKSNIELYYSERIDKPNIRDLRELNTGDVVGINGLQYFKADELKQLALDKFPVNTYSGSDHGTMYSLDAVMTELEKIKTAGGTLTAYQEAFLNNPNNVKYRKYKKNYIIGRTFYKPSEGKRIVVIPVKFGNKPVDQVFIDIETVQVEYARKLANRYKTYYKRNADGTLVTDANGNPVIDGDFNPDITSTIPKEDLALALKRLLEYRENNPEHLIFFKNNDGTTTVKGQYSSTNTVAGFNLEEQVEFMAVGDFVKFKRGFTAKGQKANMGHGVKVADLPGGILILNETGNYETVSPASITQIIFDKKSFTENEKIKLLTNELAQFNQNELTRVGAANRLRVKQEFSSDNKAMSIFPYFNKDIDTKEMNKNLKLGDVIEILAFGSDGKPFLFFGSVLFATETEIHYVTKDGKILRVGTTYRGDGAKWYNIGSDQSPVWKFGILKNSEVIETTEKKEFVKCAYHYNEDFHIIEYLNRFKRETQAAFNNAAGKRILKNDNILDIDSFTSRMVGENLGVNSIFDENGNLKLDENGKIVQDFTKSDITSEWDVEYIPESTLEWNNKDRVLELTNNMIKGDVILHKYVDPITGLTFTAWAAFSKYDKRTGNIRTIAIQKKEGKNQGKAINCEVKLEDVLAVGKRMTAIAKFEKDGLVYFANTPDLLKLRANGAQNVRLLSEGRPEQLNALKQLLKDYVTQDLHKLTFENQAEVDAFKNSSGWKLLMKIAGAIYTPEVVPDTDYDTKQPNGKFSIFMRRKDAWNTGGSPGYTLRRYQVKEKMFLIYHANKFNFEDAVNCVVKGDIAKFETTNQDGTKSYYSGIITNVSKSAIEITSFKWNDKTGEVDTRTLKPIQFRWFSSYNNIRFTELYSRNLNDAFRVSQQVRERTQGTEVKLSRNVEFKTHDSLESIATISSKLSEMYGVKSLVYDNTEVKALEELFKIKIGNARAFTINGEIYINSDLASTAEPLHELTHILLPGLKKMNRLAYDILMKKVKSHPNYELIRSKYTELNTDALDEEVFCTIFAEYYRRRVLLENELAWYSGDFDALQAEVPKVVSELFDAEVTKENAALLMNMTLDEIMISFGSSMVRGVYKKAYDLTNTLHVNSLELKIYRSLIDSGALVQIC